MAFILSSANRQALRYIAIPVMAALLAGCNASAQNQSEGAAKPQAVETVTVRLAASTRTWSYVGTVKPRYQSDLGFRVAGKVVSRLVEVGDRVRKGQVLARLDPTDFQLSLAAQDAELAAATTIRNEAEAALERYRTLFAQGHVSKAALDQRSSAAAEGRSRVERAQRAVDLARNQLSYAALAADADGVVTTLPVEAGQVVSAGQVVASVARLDAIEVEVALPEQQVQTVRDAVAEVDIWGNGNHRLSATLREVAPEADAVSRTFRARFALDRLDARRRAAILGRTATVHLQARNAKQVAALPLSAISNDGTATVAWVVSPDGTRAVPRKITIRKLEKDRALISSGLHDGERVVALGVHMLDPNKPIRAVQTRTASRQD